MPKRIVVFTRSTVDHFKSGGMETQLNTLITGLSENGYNITVITTALPQDDPLSSTDDVVVNKYGIKYVYLGGTTPGLRPATLWERLFIALKVLKRTQQEEGKLNYFEKSLEFYKKNKYDLILSQSTSGQGVINSRFYEDNKVPSIAVIHGTIKAEIKNRFRSNRSLSNWIRFIVIDLVNWIYEMNTANRKFFNNIDRVVGVSENLRLQFLDEYPYHKYKIKVIYNGVDEKIFCPGKNRPKRFTMLYVGRMDREKGVDIIIKALKLLLNEKFHVNLHLVGSGVHHDEFVELAKTLELGDHIKFEGAADYKKIPGFYKEASVFVFPTRREEAHPMTISEAFCSGVPVLATKMGGLKDLIDDGINGLFVQDDDPKDLANKIKILYKDGKLLETLRKGAYESGKEKYSKSAMVTKYLELIGSLRK